MRTPTWAEIERFCRIDGWHEVRRSGHVFYEKVLSGGTVLRTHRSFASRKTMSPGRFKAILRYQLDITEDQFWQVLETRKSIERRCLAVRTEEVHSSY